MLVFWLIAVAMLVLALWLVMSPLLGKINAIGSRGRDLNTEIFRAKLRELEAERDSGTLAAEQFEQARVELERSLLDDIGTDDQPPPPVANTRSNRAWMTAVVMLIAIPAVVVPMYLYLGRSDLLAPPMNPQDLQRLGGQKSLDYAINGLIQHLREQPDDARGWQLLGRAYMSLSRYHDGSLAYRHVYQLKPRDATAMADYAEALGLMQNDNLKGQPEALLAQALKVDPDNPKALWLGGIGRYRDGDYRQAAEYWQRLLVQMPPDAKEAEVVRRNIAQAKSQEQVQTTGKIAAAGSGVSVKVHVSLDPKLAAKALPGTTVFVFARAVHGPPMPLAIAKLVVKDLPTTVTLDDSLSMSPAAKLSNFPEVRLTARVSRSGQAMPQSGDMEGATGPVEVGAGKLADIVINKLVP